MMIFLGDEPKSKYVLQSLNDKKKMAWGYATVLRTGSCSDLSVQQQSHP